MADEDDDDGEPTAPFWMTTFSDMVTLLLTFFVLIVAMSEIKEDRLMEALSYFKGRTNIFDFERPVSTLPLPQQDRDPTETIEAAQRIEALLEYIRQQGLEGKVEVSFRDETLHIVMTDSIMFASGRAEILAQAQDILQRISSIVDQDAESVTVVGHTDNQPIRTNRFPSNWELSAARAAAVVRFLLDQDGALDPERYRAIGQGEYLPIDTNRTPQGRARNRRVELQFSWKPWQNRMNSFQQR